MRKALMILVAVAALAIGFSACKPVEDTAPAGDNAPDADVPPETPMENG